MKKLLSALFVLALCSSAAMANVPSAENSSVSPADAYGGLVIAPDSPSPITATIQTVTVRNEANLPIPGAQVVITMGAAIRLCTTAQHSGTTNGAGQVVITLRGGGCIRNTGSAGVVTANGIPIREYADVKSPDYDGEANGVLNVGDLVVFQSGDLCHDYDNDGVVGLTDFVNFAEAYRPQHTCTLQ